MPVHTAVPHLQKTPGRVLETMTTKIYNLLFPITTVIAADLDRQSRNALTVAAHDVVSCFPPATANCTHVDHLATLPHTDRQPQFLLYPLSTSRNITCEVERAEHLSLN